MTIKNQWKTVKENWLLVVVLLVLVSLPFFSVNSGMSISSLTKVGYSEGMMEDMAMMVEPAVFRGGGVYYDSNFAPEVEERKITKSASLSSEVERGEFSAAETKLKAIITSTDSILLNENVYKSGTGMTSYLNGNYQLKVEADKYAAVISQLKDLGEVQSFSESGQDITGRYTDLVADLDAEKSRLARYKEMYNKAVDVEDKIQLTDRIFNTERTINYYEEALENMDKRVDYSTISVNLREESSGYIGVTLVKFSQLIRQLVNSFNSLLSLLFWALPYALAGLLVWWGYRRFKK